MDPSYSTLMYSAAGAFICIAAIAVGLLALLHRGSTPTCQDDYRDMYDDYSDET